MLSPRDAAQSSWSPLLAPARSPRAPGQAGPDGERPRAPGRDGRADRSRRRGDRRRADDDPRFHLQPDEGTLTIDTAEGKAGAEATADDQGRAGDRATTSTPSIPIKLTLEAPDRRDAREDRADRRRRDKAKGDADALASSSSRSRSRRPPTKAGAYEVKGMFKFGVCDKDSCHPKKQPITITVAAN